MPDESVLLGQLAEEFSGRVRRGELPSVEEYAARHPALAERIRALFPTLMFLEGMAGARIDNGATVAPGEATAAAPLAPGEAFNRYRIESELGRGGMGVVYAATHLPLDKRVALKVLPAQLGEGAGGLERFLREAQTAAGLHHTNIVPVFDIGQDGGRPYYAMQLIDGRGLDKVLEEWQAGPPADLFRQVAGLGGQVAEALAYAHQRGVIHRDIKPSNLLLDGQGVLWVTDFGLARRATDVALTRSGAVVGTPRYMSPEQAEAAKRPVDHRTDVYSLGATLYEMVARRPPFTGATPVEVLVQVIEREPVPLRKLAPGVPGDLETIILKAMAKRPEHRYQTAEDLADDLRRFLNTEPIRARRVGVLGRAVRWARRNPAVAASAVTVAVALTTGTAVSTLFAFKAAGDRDRAVAAHEEAQDHLCRSQFEQARALLASNQTGRRWRALALAAEAERLRSRPGGPRPDLPGRGKLRELAVTALLAHDARITREWAGAVLALSPDGRWALMATSLAGPAWQACQVVDLEGGDPFPLPASALRNLNAAVALSPGGEWVAVSEDGHPGVTLWDVKGRTEERLPDAPAPPDLVPEKGTDPTRCLALAFRPDDGALAGVRAVGKSRWQVLLWDLKARRAPSVLVAEVASDQPELQFSPGGRWLAVPTEAGLLALDLRGGGKPASFAFPPPITSRPPQAYAFSSDDRLLAAAYGIQGERRIVLWDLATGAEKGRIATDACWLRLAFSPDGKWLAAQDQEGDTVRFFDAVTGREEWRQVIPELKENSLVFRWHPDGRHLLSTEGTDGPVLWEPAWDRPASAVAVGGAFTAAAFSADGEWLLISPAKGDRLVRARWRAGQALEELPVPLHARTFVLSRDGRQCAVIGLRECAIWEVATGKELARLRVGEDTRLKSGAFTDEGHFRAYAPGLAETAEDGSVWDVTAGKKIWQAPKGNGIETLSPDGRRLASGPVREWLLDLGGRDVGDTTFWDVAQDEPLGRLRSAGKDFWTDRPTFSPDGRWLFTPINPFLKFRQPEGYLWGVPGGEQHLTIASSALITCCAFSADSRLLAVGHEDGTAQLWDVERGERLFGWRPHTKKVTLLAFAPDATALASCEYDAPDLAVLDLKALRRQLAEIGLDW